MEVHNVHHVSLLTPYKETPQMVNNTRNPLLISLMDNLNGKWKKFWEHRKGCQQLQYPVRWKGFSKVHDSWEPLANISADDCIKESYWRKPLAVHTLKHKNPSLLTTTPLQFNASSCPLPLLLNQLTHPPSSFPLNYHLCNHLLHLCLSQYHHWKNRYRMPHALVTCWTYLAIGFPYSRCGR